MRYIKSYRYEIHFLLRLEFQFEYKWSECIKYMFNLAKGFD